MNDIKYTGTKFHLVKDIVEWTISNMSSNPSSPKRIVQTMFCETHLQFMNYSIDREPNKALILSPHNTLLEWIILMKVTISHSHVVHCLALGTIYGIIVRMGQFT